ncbi:protein-glutamate O-methyltransferase CheR [Vibrio fluvialis]|nr:protein-glutamate O-methyltransferase CheR [Vibrio fluvialis]
MLALNEQEFELTDKDFKFIQWFMHKRVGIYLSDRKRTMVYGRISRQMRRRGLTRFAEYRTLIEKDEQECIHFINTLTTNKTQFFREYHHFEFLEKVVVEGWRSLNNHNINIWSAGCSTGEEPYSVAASLLMSGTFDFAESVNIWATDLDTQVLEHAQRGVYSQEALASIPKLYLKPCFLRGKGEQNGKIKVANRLQQFVHFQQLNLMDHWSLPNELDLILCRNVMIYFDKPTQELLITRFHDRLKPGGVLFLGHSESVGRCSPLFHHLGQTIYVKM